jgi:hypothetical protein
MKRKELKRKTIATIEACKPGVKNETEQLVKETKKSDINFFR